MIQLNSVTDREREIADAVKALRAHLGESQQEFSNRLGVVVRTVARWELESPPKGKGLQKLIDLAKENGRTDLAAALIRGISSPGSTVDDYFEAVQQYNEGRLIRQRERLLLLKKAFQHLSQRAQKKSSKRVFVNSHLLNIYERIINLCIYEVDEMQESSKIWTLTQAYAEVSAASPEETQEFLNILEELKATHKHLLEKLGTL